MSPLVLLSSDEYKCTIVGGATKPTVYVRLRSEYGAFMIYYFNLKSVMFCRHEAPVPLAQPQIMLDLI
jgi:hypothetical protein